MAETTATAAPSTAAATATPDPAAANSKADETTEEFPADLGDAGKQAIDRMKAARDDAQKQAKELKAQLDAINAANMSELEKAQKAATDAQDAAKQATAEALRFRIAAKHSISDGDAELFLTGTDEQTLERQAARLIERGPSGPRPDPSQGAKGQSAGSNDPASAFAQFIQNATGQQRP